MSKKIKIALIGSAGRMGKAITTVLSQSQRSELSAALERKDSILFGVDSGLNAGIKANQVPITDDLLKGLETADAVIDFSSVASTEAVLYACLQLNKPLVIGVTGLSEALIQKIREASEKIPIVQSPNMSVGVNLLFKLVELASGVLKENYDIEVLDIHHRHKKDSPSGTAQKLKDIMLKTLNRTEKNVIYGRHGDNYSERESEEIAIHSMRAGEVVGDHTVHFFSPEERIEIKHSAQDRKTFAVGAVKAAEFVVNQKPGLFDMFDVLGI